MAASHAALMLSTRPLAAAAVEDDEEGEEDVEDEDEEEGRRIAGPHAGEAFLLMTPVWKCIERIEELQAAIVELGKTGAPAPTAARVMRPLLRPFVAAALEPLLSDDAPEWPPARRLRWLSFAVAAMLPEIALGPGRQALLEAPGAEARMSLAFGVLSARQESLSALLALQNLQDDGPWEKQEKARGAWGRGP